MTLVEWIKRNVAARIKARQLREVEEHILWIEDQISSGEVALRQFREKQAILSAELNSLLPADQIVRNAGMQA